MKADNPRGALFRANVPNQHSRVTYAELLFDLVFVFAVTQISHTLLGRFTPLGALQTTLLFLAVWWAATDGRHVTGFAASFSFVETMKALRHLVVERDLWADVAASLRRILAGLAISVAIGVPLGCAVGALGSP